MPPATAVMPTVGCVVHYRAEPDSDAEAAMIVAVHSDRAVNLVVWDRQGVQRSEATVELAGEPPEGPSWSWPPRVG